MLLDRVSGFPIVLLCFLFVASLEGHSHPTRLNRNQLRVAEYAAQIKATARSARSTEFRLPGDTTPELYLLELNSNIHKQDFNYNGKVLIQVRVLQATRSIVLNSLGLRIGTVSVKYGNDIVIPIAAVLEEPEREMFTIRTGVELTQGSLYTVEISFEGVLRNDMSGFYWTSYYVQGEERFAAVTQFQPVDARTAFPCYDEPGIRATFIIVINCGVDMKVHSNMPVSAIRILGNGMKQTRFQLTPQMPTYLVAFAITNGFVSARTSLKSPPSSINMELLAPPSSTASARAYGLNQGAAVIRAVEQYFNQSYELPKLDQLAVPDFYFAAMENWGLVIYAEPYLLYDEATDSNRDKENVLATIVHELVHQFLGNLLTPHWWSDLFLSEGFATLYEYYLTSEIDPSIRFKDFITVEAVQTAMLLDSNINVRPLSYEVDTRRDVDRMFDIISYQKGGSILRMFHHALGADTFQKGVRRYINTNKGRSVTPQDLFASLQIAADEGVVLPLSFEIASLMSPWIYQSGYPLVTVELRGEELLFRQEHYLTSPTTPPSNRTWWIPITYDILSNGPTQRTQLWMPQGTSQLSWMDDRLSAEAPVLVNPQQTGYYRVNYDVELWQRLIERLNSNHASIPPASRGQLLDDCFKLFQTDRVDTTVLFSLLQYTGQDVDAVPWTVALAPDNLGALRGILVADESAFDAFANFVSTQLTNVYNLVGFDTLPQEPHEMQQLRSLVIEWSCRMGITSCRTEALTRMLNDLAGTTLVPPYLRESVYCGGATIATAEQLLEVWLALETITSYQQRSIVINFLGCSESSVFLDTYLDTVLTQPSFYRPGEWQQVLAAVYQNSAIGFQAFDRWLERNTLQILLSLGTDAAFLDIVADITQRSSDINQYSELIALLKQF